MLSIHEGGRQQVPLHALEAGYPPCWCYGEGIDHVVVAVTVQLQTVATA